MTTPMTTTTANGAFAHATTGSAHLDLFFDMVRGASIRHIRAQMERSHALCPQTMMRIVFHKRDCRGGGGERDLFRECIQYIANTWTEELRPLVHLIPEYGRWDDLIALEGTPLGETAKDIVAHQLLTDRRAVLEGDSRAQITLLAKWMPSANSKGSFSRGIRKRLGVTREGLRRQYLTPLRKHLRILETDLTEDNYIELERVPSRALFFYRKALSNKANWQAFIEERQSKGDIKQNSMDVHEIVKAMMRGEDNELLETMWEARVAEIKAAGGIKNAIAVVDGSYSMYSNQAIYPAVALGLVVSECASEAFRGMLITFSQSPKFVDVRDMSLREQIEGVTACNHLNTDFQKVFEKLLERAVNKKLPQSEMPEHLFVFSDMQFDQCGRRTNFDAIRDKFTYAGYRMPHMVFWNLVASVDKPSTINDNVTMLSGFNTAILKNITIGRTDAVLEVLNSERYAPIVVKQ